MSVVDVPGFYADIPEAEYHADPVSSGSLSVSGSRKLLPPNCPARFAYEREHGSPPKDAFDFGRVAHQLILGVGGGIAVVEADSWRTKSAQQQRDEARAAGLTPLLAADAATVEAMATALRQHPVAARLLAPDTGRPEVSMFWVDVVHDVWRRGRIDFLPDPVPGRRLLVTDYKTAVSAEPGRFARGAADYGYHQQAAWYIDGIRALGLDEDPAFLFVVQEKTPPYLVSVIALDEPAIRIGRVLNDRALEVYAECSATGCWPSYSDDVEYVSLPPWVLRQMEEVPA